MIDASSKIQAEEEEEEEIELSLTSGLWQVCCQSKWQGSIDSLL